MTPIRKKSDQQILPIQPNNVAANDYKSIVKVMRKTNPPKIKFFGGLFVNECQSISTYFNRCDILIVLLTLSGRKEVTFLELLISFFLSVGASVVAYYICKWLDR